MTTESPETTTTSLTQPEPAPEQQQQSEPSPSIYGDLEVKWPEGMEDTLREDPSIKPFVKEDGNINFANVLKSYVHTKKQIGADRFRLPDEHTTPEEAADFYNKLHGWDPNYENYKFEKREESELDDEFLEKVRHFAHENKLSPKTLQGLYDMFEEQASEESKSVEEFNQEFREEALNNLKQRWGAATDSRIQGARKLTQEYLSDVDHIYTALTTDPNVGDNPVILEILGTMASKIYKDHELTPHIGTPAKTPDEIDAEIGSIMGDSSHPYFRPDHPGHAKAVKDMEKLYAMKGSNK